MTFGSLFSGIGGIDLGLERAGMKCLWQVEINPFCRRVLKKHWPDVKRLDNVKFAGAKNLEPVDLVAGGFPCQDVSEAGKRTGIQKDNNSGLWIEFHRIICELRPRYVFVENVTGLLIDGMGRVLGDLASIGYNAEWEVLSAADVGAPHLRKRVFIVAHSDSAGRQEQRRNQPMEPKKPPTERGRLHKIPEKAAANTTERRLQHCRTQPEHPKLGKTHPKNRGFWETEPDVGRVADGVPKRVDRLKGLGNAVVPQCAEYIARKIITEKI